MIVFLFLVFFGLSYYSLYLLPFIYGYIYSKLYDVRRKYIMDGPPLNIFCNLLNEMWQYSAHRVIHNFQALPF